MKIPEHLLPAKFFTVTRALILLGALFAVLLALIAREFVRSYSRNFAVERINTPTMAMNRTQRFSARALDYARLSDTIALLSKGMTAEQAESLASSLEPLGVARLDSAQLIERANLLVQMLDQDSAQCDAKESGAPGDNALGTGIEGLDSASLEKWTRLNAEAAGAQLRGSPAPAQPTYRDQQQLGNDVLEALGDSAFGKWSKIVGDTKSSSAAEKCWAQRAMYRAVMSMPVGEQARDLRTISAIEAESP